MTLISKPFTYTGGAVIFATQQNSNLDTIYNDYNGSISDSNISATAAIAWGKLAAITARNISFAGGFGVNTDLPITGNVPVTGNVTVVDGFYGIGNFPKVTKRNTVMTGALTAGIPSALQIGTGTAVNLLATTTPVVVTFANGTDTAGHEDYIAKISTTVASAWSALTVGTWYLYIDRNISTGAITYNASTLVPIDGYFAGTGISVVSGQHTFDWGQNQYIQLVGTGATTTQVQRVFIGEAVSNGAAITSVTTYAYNGLYVTPLTTPLTGTATSTTWTHNIGSINIVPPVIQANCLTAEFGFAIGDRINPFTAPNVSFVGPFSLAWGRLTASVRTGISTAWEALHKTAGNNISLTAASWNFGTTIERYW